MKTLNAISNAPAPKLPKLARNRRKIDGATGASLTPKLRDSLAALEAKIATSAGITRQILEARRDAILETLARRGR